MPPEFHAEWPNGVQKANATAPEKLFSRIRVRHEIGGPPVISSTVTGIDRTALARKHKKGGDDAL